MKKNLFYNVLWMALGLLIVSCAKDPLFEKGDYIVEDSYLVKYENANHFLVHWAEGVTDEEKAVVENLLNNMVKVDGGTFMMGAQSTDSTAANYDAAAADDESPVHKVSLSDFYINRYEVTQKEWRTLMGEKQQVEEKYGLGDNFPVYYVLRDEALAFVQRLSELTGLEFSLPTEAQWEYAARGGQKSQATRYSGSANADQVAWHVQNSGYTSHEVGKKQPNELGLYDMSGNVWEWCADSYNTYISSEMTDPLIDGHAERVLRGGSWCYMTDRCRVTTRDHAVGTNTNPACSFGFRVALKYIEK